MDSDLLEAASDLRSLADDLERLERQAAYTSADVTATVTLDFGRTGGAK